MNANKVHDAGEKLSQYLLRDKSDMIYFLFIKYLVLSFSIFPKKYKTIALLLITFGLVIFSGFRFESGIDYSSYLTLYNYSYLASTEYFYWFISIAHKYIFNSYPLFIFMVAATTIPIKVYVINKLSENVFLSLFVYICLSYIYVDMGFIRNSISLLFFMLFILMYIKGNKKLAFFLFMTAFLFHHSVIFMSYIFFLGNEDNKVVSRKYFFLIVVSALLAYLGVLKEVSLVVLDQLSSFKYIYSKLSHYLNSEIYQNENLNIYNLRYLFMSLIFYYFRNKIKNYFLIKVYLLGTCLLLAFGFNIQIYTRIGIFLAFFEVLLMSYLVNLFRGYNRLFFVIIVSVFYGILFFRTSYIMDIDLIKFL
jgi:hypothetical protein